MTITFDPALVAHPTWQISGSVLGPEVAGCGSRSTRPPSRTAIRAGIS
jgi:hypothetical protein